LSGAALRERAGYAAHDDKEKTENRLMHDLPPTSLKPLPRKNNERSFFFCHEKAPKAQMI
jgi:hypothetical protein